MSGTVAPGSRFGPVDLYLLSLPGRDLDPATISELVHFVDTGLVRLLDLTVLTKSEDGKLTLVKAEELPDGFELDVASLGATGLINHNDIAGLAVAIPAGTSALLVAIELTYQRDLAARTSESRVVVLGDERIPATVVNALADTITPRTKV